MVASPAQSIQPRLPRLRRHTFVAWGAAILVAAFALMPHASAMSFVHRSGDQLTVDGHPFYHLGFNAYYLPTSAALGDTNTVDTVLDSAQGLGLTVIRTWVFNQGFPSSAGVYDEQHGRALDYVVAGAEKRGLRLLLALGNFWAAYLGPEDWLKMAEGSASGKSIVDFYKSPAVASLYSNHIYNVAGRVNHITGRAYRDEPAIMGWDLINEPRCPGCDEPAIAARDAFLASLSQALKTAAPNQLTFSGTEGYFAPWDANVAHNPGAGAKCEGEDWSKEIQYFDVATTHMYYRQMEAMKGTWQKPDFNYYINYLHKKLELYTELAHRPLVVEEFGLTKRYFGDEERKVVFAVMSDALISAKRAGKPLIGALFWSAISSSFPLADDDGYSLDITRQPSGAYVGLGQTSVPATRRLVAMDLGNKRFSMAAGIRMHSQASGQNAAVPRTMHRRMLLEAQPSEHRVTACNTTEDVVNVSDGINCTAQAQNGTVHGNQSGLQFADDHLDDFRLGPQRRACGIAAWEAWNMADVPQNAVDVRKYRDMVAGHDIVDIIAEATRLLRE